MLYVCSISVYCFVDKSKQLPFIQISVNLYTNCVLISCFYMRLLCLHSGETAFIFGKF